MPTLNKYVESNEKTGFFIRANVGGNHPITLQTTGVAKRIFRDNGYSEGNTIPTKLVWSMYDVDLLYTESSHTTKTPAHSFNTLSSVVNGSQLSESTRHELIEYFNRYSGSHEKEVSRLLNDLRETTSSEAKEAHKVINSVESIENFFSKFSEASVEELNILIEKYGETPRNSLLSFLKQTSILERIEITDHSTILYHFGPLSVPGTATVYDSMSQVETSEGEQYDYCIKYKNGDIISIFLQDGKILRVNGQTNDFAPSDARRLVDEVVPVKINPEDVRSTIDAPPVSEVDIPESAFTSGQDDLVIGVVNRISDNKNPVVELEDGNFILDSGEVGHVYLIDKGGRHGRVLCETPFN